MGNKTIVVTGSTGNIGSRVVLDLTARRRYKIIAFVRDLQKAQHLTQARARLRRGTFEDSASIREAFAGADTVVLNTTGETLADQAITAIRGAREVGVRKIVRISSGKATIDGPTESTRQHAHADEVLRASGLAFVILRNHTFMQNLLFAVGTLRDDGKLYSGTGSAKFGFIDVRDIAEAAESAAVNDTWNGQTLDLTGPAALDYGEVAAAIGRELGREITYVPVTPAAAGEAARMHGATAWDARAITEFALASSNGWGNYTTDSVAKLTGHAPRSIKDFIHEVLAPAVRGE
jgi:uncharacterized protein YbjT (DUF2867 family)